jgi:hypothetical protein
VHQEHEHQNTEPDLCLPENLRAFKKDVPNSFTKNWLN